MNGFHLTPIGGGDSLLEPTRGFDSSMRDSLIEAILERLQAAKSSRLYYDLAEVAIIDPVAYEWLDALARACQAVNVKMICVHMQPTAAFTLSQFLNGTPIFEVALDVDERRRKF